MKSGNGVAGQSMPVAADAHLVDKTVLVVWDGEKSNHMKHGEPFVEVGEGQD
jgi:hypothetical protein